MELYEFNSLSDQDKAEYLWEHGTHLASFRENECSFVLYNTPDFYVEIELSSSLRCCIRAFKKGPLLERYLERVDLKSLAG